MDLKTELSSFITPDRILTRPIDRYAYASDASYFRLIPQVVVQPVSIDEILALFRFSQQKGIPMTFRAAGTSLSGQAVSDGILVDISRHWGRVTVEEDGALVRVQPGVIGAFVNIVLNPYGRRIGPDPASIDSCMMGGILANNSSGMCCGVAENAYHTIHSLTIVLPNGLVLNTGEAEAASQLLEGAPDIVSGLLDLRRRLIADSELTERVRSRYQMKNTNGYALNALLDYEKPIEILTHLMIGSEGTLGFIAEAVLHTLPNLTCKYTGMLYFKNIQEAANAIAPLRASGVRAAEIMDRASLRTVENLPGAPALLRQLPDTTAAILVEYQGASNKDLDTFRRSAKQTIKNLTLIHEAEFTEEPGIQADLWKLRKGMLPSVGAMRAPGTYVLSEDLVFPIERLAEAITDLQSHFKDHGYSDAIIFGHARDGNLHFVMSLALNTTAEVMQFKNFMGDVVATVCGKYDGALKGEHGVGRSKSPFLETEWGAAAYAIMHDLKDLFDPRGTLNPGVVINANPNSHVSDIKSLPVIEPEIDKCIECGNCEPLCPSRRLTLTPRQRIVIRREIARQRTAGTDAPLLASLMDDYVYAGMETCAVDGLCASACPVDINTGDLTKRLRAESISMRGEKAALWLSDHFSTVEKALGAGVRLGHFMEQILGTDAIISLTRLTEKLTGLNLPKWNPAIPHVPSRLPTTPRAGAAYVYFPSCVSRQMGSPEPHSASLAETLVTIAKRAGIPIWIPADVNGNCCGMPFGSKGYTATYKATLHRTLGRFWDWSEGGRLPIVIDTTSCAYTLRSSGDALTQDDREILNKLTLLDSIEFVHDVILPRLEIHPTSEDVILHPNCSARKLNLQDKLVGIARSCAKTVTVPLNLDCCGFAGDRGLLFPELTASATELEAAEVNARTYSGYYCSNIPCEMGMSAATGRNYRSIVYLVEAATR